MLAVCMRLFSRRCLRHTQKCGLLDLSSTRAFVLRSIRICRTGSPRRQMRGGRVLRVLQGNVPRCPCFHDTILPCPGAFVNWHLLRHRAKVRGLSQEGPFYLSEPGFFDSGPGFFPFVTPFFRSVTLSAYQKRTPRGRSFVGLCSGSGR